MTIERIPELAIERILIAPDKFKGSLTANEVAAELAAGFGMAVPDVLIDMCPVADGGEGTVDAAVAAGFTPVTFTATGPTGVPVQAKYAERDGTAVIELSATSGLDLLPGGTPAPLTATSRGAGEAISAAIDRGCRTVVLGLGGSACTDGGAGMVAALGARLLDRAGHEIAPGGAALRELHTVDLVRLHSRLAEVDVVVASDVDNPLLGTHGAAAVYGPQKGATPGDVTVLEAALGHWSSLVSDATGRDVSARPGAGAAGGVGFAAMAVLGATLRPGIDLMLDLVGFASRLSKVDLVITGEGSVDAQTLRGKAPVGIAIAATRAGVPTIVVGGRVLLDESSLQNAGFEATYALTDIEPDSVRCMAEARSLLQETAFRIAADRV
ncbi:glycerate kinase [Rhodococcus sp. 27YEA15]|uniref:glycerate kinase n=1 Tax=Rhodococcus sp. 27YEA15 TaxID=3156259 RepID=UPI003C7CEEFC